MLEYDFNGTKLRLKTEMCRLWDNEVIDIYPQTNLYIRINNRCNANCRFCEYHGDKTEFSFERLELALNELSERGIIYKIQITGGETTLDRERLSTVVSLIRKYFDRNEYFVGINSNGYDLQAVLDVRESIQNIAISRHHYDDSVNSEIFGTLKVPTTQELKDFIAEMTPDMVHLSCNLMKDYIGSMDEIKKYLNYCIEIGCKDMGFVTLMPVNEFAQQQHVLFDECGIEEDPLFYKYKQFTKCGNCCKCANYLYTSPTQFGMIDLYGRFVSKPDNTTGLISFDGYNLREGFNGSIINI